MTLKNLLNNCMKEYAVGKIRFAMAYEQEPEVEVLEVTPDVQKEMDKLSAVIKKIHVAHK